MQSHMILFLLTTSIVFFSDSCTPLSDKDKVQRKIIEINNRHVKMLPPHYNITIIGDGLSGHDKLRGVHLHYCAAHPNHINGIRKLLVSLVESYLIEFNAEESIKDGLLAPPFNHRNLSIIISFRDEKGERIYMSDDAEPISYVMMLRGEIWYTAQGRGLGERKTVFEETYEEAFKKVRSLEAEELAPSDNQKA